MPVPFLATAAGAATITGVGNLLNSILQGIAGGAAEKKKFKNWEKMLGMRMNVLKREVKPSGEFYDIGQNLQTLDPIVNQAVLNLLTQRFGGSMGSFGNLFGGQGGQQLGQQRSPGIGILGRARGVK